MTPRPSVTPSSWINRREETDGEPVPLHRARIERVIGAVSMIVNQDSTGPSAASQIVQECFPDGLDRLRQPPPSLRYPELPGPGSLRFVAVLPSKGEGLRRQLASLRRVASVCRGKRGESMTRRHELP